MISHQKTHVGGAEWARGRVQQDEFGDMQGARLYRALRTTGRRLDLMLHETGATEGS